MASLITRTALWGAVTGAALGSGLAAYPAKALTLIDNTNEGAQPLGPTAGFISTQPPNSFKTAVTFDTSPSFPAYNRFDLTVGLSSASGINPGTISVSIYEALPSGEPGNTLVHSTDFSSLPATTASGVKYKFRFDTGTPKLLPSKKYSFVLQSSNSSANPLNLIAWNQSVLPFTSNTPASYQSSWGYNGTAWLSQTATPYFYLDGVPGPLPILGAGSAFAWSRRLRKRVSAARKADASATPV